MRIEIQGVRFALTAPLLDHTARQLRVALARTGDRIKRVVVRLGVGKRPRPGENKFCRIRVVLEHAPPVRIEDAGADLYAAIDRAAERAGRGVANSVDRQRERVRLAGLQPDALSPDESSGALRY
jgi:putative sigma-54 modulation protein